MIPKYSYCLSWVWEFNLTKKLELYLLKLYFMFNYTLEGEDTRAVEADLQGNKELNLVVICLLYSESYY